MTLEEATAESSVNDARTIATMVGKREVTIKIDNNQQYGLYVNEEPVWKGKDITWAKNLGFFTNVEDVKKRIAELPFAADIDPNGWTIDRSNMQS